MSDHSHSLDKGQTWTPCTLLDHCPSYCDHLSDQCDAHVPTVAELAELLAPVGNSVRDIYGDEAAALVANGWTVDSAIDHVQGHCDRVCCTHPIHRLAELLEEAQGLVEDITRLKGERSTWARVLQTDLAVGLANLEGQA